MTLCLSSLPGINADGVTDDLTTLQTALSSGTDTVFDGGGKSYAIYGNLNLPLNCFIFNATFIQLDPNTYNRRSLFYNHTTGNWGLHRVRVEQLATPNTGDINQNSAIRANGGSPSFSDVFVKFNGYGSGIQLVNIYDFSLRNVTIEEGECSGWSPSLFGGKECMIGLWLNGATNGLVDNLTVNGLKDRTGPGVNDVRTAAVISGIGYNITDGLTMGGCNRVKVVNGTIRNVGEGVDLTGTSGNGDNRITGLTIRDIGSHGVKLANSATRNKVDNNTIVKCGYAGVCISGPNETGLWPVTLNRIENNLIDATGFQTIWAGFTRAGIKVQAGSASSTMPSNNTFARNRIDNQNYSDWAIHSEISGNWRIHNEVYNCPSGISSNVTTLSV